jgi:hypothetical protein
MSVFFQPNLKKHYPLKETLMVACLGENFRKGNTRLGDGNEYSVEGH